MRRVVVRVGIGAPAWNEPDEVVREGGFAREGDILAVVAAWRDAMREGRRSWRGASRDVSYGAAGEVTASDSGLRAVHWRILGRMEDERKRGRSWEDARVTIFGGGINDVNDPATQRPRVLKTER